MRSRNDQEETKRSDMSSLAKIDRPQWTVHNFQFQGSQKSTPSKKVDPSSYQSKRTIL